MNAGHILGLALLIGAIVPLDLRLAGILSGPSPAETTTLLRPIAIAGLILAVICGTALFTVQATDYIASPWFRAKMVILAGALANAALYLARPTRAALLASLTLWPLVLFLGRMIGFS